MNRTEVRALVAAAIDTLNHNLGKSFNVSFERGSASFDSNGCSFKVEAVQIGRDSKEVKDFKRNAELYGLEESDLGKTFNSHGKTMEIIGANPRAHRYPILVKDANGKIWKYAVSTVQLRMGKLSPTDTRSFNQS